MREIGGHVVFIVLVVIAAFWSVGIDAPWLAR